MNYAPASCLKQAFAYASSNLKLAHVYYIVTMVSVEVGCEFWYITVVVWSFMLRTERDDVLRSCKLAALFVVIDHLH